jgi:hypothetical protein
LVVDRVRQLVREGHALERGGVLASEEDQLLGLRVVLPDHL